MRSSSVSQSGGEAYLVKPGVGCRVISLPAWVPGWLFSIGTISIRSWASLQGDQPCSRALRPHPFIRRGTIVARRATEQEKKRKKKG